MTFDSLKSSCDKINVTLYKKRKRKKIKKDK